MTEQEKYERLWKEHQAYRTVAPGESLADHFLSIAKPQPHHVVIDFGCGTGRGALKIRQRGCTVHAIDFADGCLDPKVKAELGEGFAFWQHDLTKPWPKDWIGDYGYCTDVLEHIAPQDVPVVLQNILQAARRVYLCISTVEDRMGALIGEPLHLTVQPHAWWKEQLEKIGFKIGFERDCGNASIFYGSAWATFDDFEHRTIIHAQDNLKANVHANLSLGLNEVAPYEPQDTEISLLCGGPSLNDFAGQIKGPIVTVNGAYNWAIRNGLTPGLQVIVDAREFNARFTSPVVAGCKYAISSQCDHALVASLPKEQVLLWHGAGEEVQSWLREYDEARGQAREYYPVPGGTTVTLRALPLLAMLGFRKINVYGFDSCVRKGEHHAYAQEENDGDGLIPIEVDGKEFLCAGWMAKQAQEFQEVMRHILIPAGVELAIHGDGLIAAIIAAAAARSH